MSASEFIRGNGGSLYFLNKPSFRKLRSLQECLPQITNSTNLSNKGKYLRREYQGNSSRCRDFVEIRFLNYEKDSVEIRTKVGGVKEGTPQDFDDAKGCWDQANRRCLFG